MHSLTCIGYYMHVILTFPILNLLSYIVSDKSQHKYLILRILIPHTRLAARGLPPNLFGVSLQCSWHSLDSLALVWAARWLSSSTMWSLGWDTLASSMGLQPCAAASCGRTLMPRYCFIQTPTSRLYWDWGTTSVPRAYPATCALVRRRHQSVWWNPDGCKVNRFHYFKPKLTLNPSPTTVWL